MCMATYCMASGGPVRETPLSERPALSVREHGKYLSIQNPIQVISKDSVPT